MQVSVVIPTFRRPAYLQKCLEALTKQSLPHTEFEIIVVSDGPDEVSANLFNKFSKNKKHRLQYYALPEKKGPAAARNYGWLAAKAPLVAFTDDDCLPDGNWLSAFLHNYKQNDLVAFTGKTIVPLPGKPTDYERNVAHLQTADFITANCCCSKAALAFTGGFDERFEMAWREDSDLQFKLMLANIPIMKVEGAIIVHPVRQPAWGVSIKEQKKTMFNVLLYKKYPELYRKNIQPVPPLLYYAIIIAAIIGIAGVASKQTMVFYTGSALWLLLTGYFLYRRLQQTVLTMRHISEMAVTSVVIPFASIYWQWYGSIKYKVVLL